MIGIDPNRSERKFAYLPAKMDSGKRVWWCYYIKTTVGGFQLNWDGDANWKYEHRYFTEAEWTFELLKQ